MGCGPGIEGMSATISFSRVFYGHAPGGSDLAVRFWRGDRDLEQDTLNPYGVEMSLNGGGLAIPKTVDQVCGPNRVTPARLEHATCGLGNRRSIQLSYGAGGLLLFVGSGAVQAVQLATGQRFHHGRHLAHGDHPNV
jgi:hypothetical protein